MQLRLGPLAVRACSPLSLSTFSTPAAHRKANLRLLKVTQPELSPVRSARHNTYFLHLLVLQLLNTTSKNNVIMTQRISYSTQAYST